MRAGEVYELWVEIFPAAARVPAGHTLRLAVQPSDWPHLSPSVRHGQTSTIIPGGGFPGGGTVDDPAPKGIDRRAFLARMGVLGAAVALGRPALAGAARAGGGGDQVRLLLAELSGDTLSGLAAFVVPGPDPYSVAQWVSTPEDGALAARTPDFLLDALTANRWAAGGRPVTLVPPSPPGCSPPRRGARSWPGP